MNFFILSCSNNSDVINESIENCSPLTFMKFRYKFLIIKAKYKIVVSLHWTPFLEPLSVLYILNKFNRCCIT